MSAPGRGKVSGRAFLSYGFRPFFLGAALWASIALALWIAMLSTDLALPSRFDPLSWHTHEMLFGFVLAAVAGFLLTAIPNWTGRPSARALLRRAQHTVRMTRDHQILIGWDPSRR